MINRFSRLFPFPLFLIRKSRKPPFSLALLSVYDMFNDLSAESCDYTVW